jgi:predicted metal-dependent TIM-barrel fold hydrolase
MGGQVMGVPESHYDIIEDKTRAVISTVDQNSEVHSAICFIIEIDDDVYIDSINDEQIEHLLTNNRASILTIDPNKVDRWFCIQGEIKSNSNKSKTVKIK